ncbi:hypothetical protein Tco_1092999 [Tanacetum coccineum]|uniref:Reverse transcriptase Ty1/copia-type domain-containing protein n=1 Tax=Tanacetum coccineum TaxID=301880 RepID=A0ABQ5ICQ1_9ASTR
MVMCLFKLQELSDERLGYTVDDDACKKTVQEPARTFSPGLEPSSGPSFVPFGGSFPIDAVCGDPTKISQALMMKVGVEVMQEELLQFKDSEGDSCMELSQTVAQWVYKQEEGIDYDEVFAPIARVESNQNFQKKSISGKKALYGLLKILELVKEKEDGIFISQDKYVGEILKKFGFFSIRSARTPMETHKALTKDEDGKDVDVHLYSSAKSFLLKCSKGQPKLGLWYLKDSPLILEAFSDSDYAGASLDGNSTTEDVKTIFLLVLRQRFMLTMSVLICGSQNLFYHFTNSYRIRINFIRDSYEKRLIEMVKIHTDYNVADLLTKVVDVTSVGYTPHNKWSSIHHVYRQERIGYSRANGNWTRTRRIGIRIPQSDVPTSVADEAIIKEMHDGLVRATTTASSLEAEQGSGTLRPERVLTCQNEPPLENGNNISKWSRVLKHKEDGQFNLLDSQRLWKDKVSDDEDIFPDRMRIMKKLHKIRLTLAETLLNIKRSAAKEQAQILQDEVYAKQVEAQWIVDEERIPQEAKQTDEREKVINWNDPDVLSSKKTRGSKKKTLARKRLEDKGKVKKGAKERQNMRKEKEELKALLDLGSLRKRIFYGKNEFFGVY